MQVLHSMDSLHNEVAITNASLLSPCPTAAALIRCTVASHGPLTLTSLASPSSPTPSAHVSAEVSLGTATPQRPMPPLQTGPSGAKIILPRQGFLGQFTCVLLARNSWPSSVVAAVASRQLQGSGFWAHPAVGDAALHALGAALGRQTELLLPTQLGCYAPGAELQGACLL